MARRPPKAESTPKKAGGKKKAKFVARGNDRYDRHDTYYRKAKSEGYLARSIYKLEEIDEQLKVLKPSDWVLDLGCAPGSWLQYVSRKVKPEKNGQVVGIDLLPVATNFPAHVHVIENDVYEINAEDLLPPSTNARAGQKAPFDVILSDMAPNTTGVRAVDQARSIGLCERALSLAESLLKKNGNFCFKVFEGGELANFILLLRKQFKTVKVRRPKGTRPGSMETYVVALGYHALHRVKSQTVSEEEE
jgi:23S rRNA (uridine2552-2'-O)-methyltransferase